MQQLQLSIRHHLRAHIYPPVVIGILLICKIYHLFHQQQQGSEMNSHKERKQPKINSGFQTHVYFSQLSINFLTSYQTYLQAKICPQRSFALALHAVEISERDACRRNVWSKVLFSSQKILQNFSDSPSHRIFRGMHEVLNIDENKN